MQAHVREFRVTAMCRALVVSRSGFYAWRKRLSESSPRAQFRAQVDGQVAQLFAAHKARYGSPRLTRELAQRGCRYDEKTVAFSLQRQGLRAKAARRFKATTQSKHDLPVAPNVLRQDFTATGPNQKWAGDITYLWTDEGWLYLAVAIDLFSRAVVGWAMAERMTAELVCEALSMALWRRQMPRNVIVHTGRGSQYCSAQYRALLATHTLHASMSAKGNCYDNACAESFFHTLKVEAIHGERFATREALRHTVFEYIEVDYNRTRRHSALGYVSPALFEAQRVA